MRGVPQHFTRRGKRAVVVLSEQDFEALQRSAAGRADKPASFIEHLLAMPKAPAADFRDGVEPEIAEFERGLLESIGQMKRGEVGRVHTPKMIAGYKTRGRPVGSVKAEAKQAVTVRYSPEVLASFKASGKGWQARMNYALKEWLQTHSPV